MYSHSIPIIESPPGHGWDSKGEGGSHLGAMAAKMAAKRWWNNSEDGGKMVGSSKENAGLTCLKQRTWELKYQNMGELSVLQQPWIALMLCFFPTAGWWMQGSLTTTGQMMTTLYQNEEMGQYILQLSFSPGNHIWYIVCLQHIFLFNDPLEDLCWETQFSPSPWGAKDPTHLGAELSRVFGVRQWPEIRVLDI